jgi:hypothetical protein
MNQDVATLPPPMAWPIQATERMQLCRELSTARLVPTHFQKSPADLFLASITIERLGLDFFLTIGECYMVGNKLGFSGKLAQAMLNTSGRLAELIDHRYEGDGDDRTITTTGRIDKEAEPRVIKVRLGDAKTKNENWTKIPDQMLAYYAARTWGRRHMPEVLLGMQFKEELEDIEAMKDVTPKKEGEAKKAPTTVPDRTLGGDNDEAYRPKPKPPERPEIAKPEEPPVEEPHELAAPDLKGEDADKTRAWRLWCERFIGLARTSTNGELVDAWLSMNFEVLGKLSEQEPTMYRKLQDAISKHRVTRLEMPQ